MTPDNARFMLRQRGYVEGQDWLAHCVNRGQAGNDVGLELALIILAERGAVEDGASPVAVNDAMRGIMGDIAKRGPGRPRKVA